MMYLSFAVSEDRLNGHAPAFAAVLCISVEKTRA